MVFWLPIACEGVEVVVLLKFIALLGTVLFLGFSSFFWCCVGVGVARFLLAFLGILFLMGLPANGVLILFCLFRNSFIFCLKLTIGCIG